MEPNADPFDLGGRVAVVTGATRGIGRAIAEGLAGRGASVLITGRDPTVACEVAEEMTRSGHHVVGVAAEMAEPADLDRVIGTAVTELGGLDILVNNAALDVVVAPEDIGPELLHQTLDVNVAAPLLLARAAHPHLAAGGRGSVINVLSAAAFMAMPHNALYAASKAALLSLTRSSAARWAPDGIRVNALVPGPTETEVLRAMGSERRAAIAARTMLGRIARPDELAGAAVFLASDASSYVTGQSLSVDGGLAPR